MPQEETLNDQLLREAGLTPDGTLPPRRTVRPLSRLRQTSSTRTPLIVDGELWRQEIPELERAGETLGTDYFVQADRLDGDLWEIRASAL